MDEIQSQSDPTGRIAMMRGSVICVIASLFFLSVVSGCSGSPPIKQSAKLIDLEKIRQQAQYMSQCLIKGDYEKWAEFAHPKLVEMMGGRANMIAESKKMMDGLKKEDIEILSFVVQLPKEVIGTDPDLAVILPNSVRMRLRKKVITQSAFLLAVSSDSGVTWSLVDGAQLTPEMMQKVLPPSLQKIKVPGVPEPTLEK